MSLNVKEKYCSLMVLEGEKSIKRDLINPQWEFK